MTRTTLLKVRLDGDPHTVADVAAAFRSGFHVVDESPDYPSRAPSLSVRRYLTLIAPVPGEVVTITREADENRRLVEERNG